MSLELHLQQVRDPARRLRDEGCCGLCVLRLTGAPDRASYRQPLGSVERLLDEHVGGQQGGTRRSVQAARPRELPPGVAKPAAAAAADKSVRAFVTTKDATLFSGAKLVQVDTTDPAALRKSIAKAIGHEGVLLEVKLNGKAPLTSADAVQALGSNPRLEVARDATPAAAAAAVATPAATTATAATNSAPPPTGMTAPPGVDTQVQPAPGAATAAPEFVCCACLGILQHATSELCSEMITSIRRDGWECPRGQRTILGFAIPSDVLVRDRLLEMVGFPAGPPARRAFELKQTLTWLFESVLQEELGCQMVPAAVQDAGNYGMSIVLSWKPKSGVLSDAHRVAVRCGGANQHGQQSRKRQRPNNGGGGGSSVDTSWQTVQRLLSSVDSMKLRDLCEFPPRKLAERVAPMEMQIHRPSIYVAGRYSKFERGLSQTPWSYAEPGATSVQEIISDLLAPYFKPEKATFTSGGREDMDVRMLGSGRPFAFIMENPRVLASSVSAEQISVAEADVNKSALGRCVCTMPLCTRVCEPCCYVSRPLRGCYSAKTTTHGDCCPYICLPACLPACLPVCLPVCLRDDT
jgi:hypothetical protein